MMVKIGDVLPWEPRPPLFFPAMLGDPVQHRYALRCAPLREERAVAHLRENGVTAFFPIVRRTVTVRGRPQERKQVFLPGYVFAHFPGEPNWPRVFDRENPARVIVDVIRMTSGAPGRIREADLASIRAMVDEEEERLAKERKAKEEARDPVRPGDIIRIPSIVGLDAEVIEITAKGGKRVRLTMFGATREFVVEGPVEKVLDSAGVNPKG